MRRFWWLLLLLLAGCVETEARLVWHEDGSMDLTIEVRGTGSLLLDPLAEGFRDQGFWVSRRGDAIVAWRPIKAPGWDRLSGWLPGRFAYRDPSGVEFSRTSFVVFEDYRLAGSFRPLEAAGLPEFLASEPFRFVVEAPFPPLASNAGRVEGRRAVWEGRLGEVFEVDLLYRLWYPERAAALLAPVILVVLWRRLRRTRSG